METLFVGTERLNDIGSPASACFKWQKGPYTICHNGRSLESIRHWQTVRTIYKLALMNFHIVLIFRDNLDEIREYIRQLAPIRYT